MYSKAQIFNLALDALLLQRRIVDAEADTSSEAKTLRLNYPLALEAALQEMDLDCAHITVTLELVTEDPNKLWKYAYKYPSKCINFRRIVSEVRKDNLDSRVPHKTGTINNVKVVLTDQCEAEAEIIPEDLNLSVLPVHAIMAIAYKLAFMSASLNVGKGAKAIREEINNNFTASVMKAQAQDRGENDTFEDPLVNSTWVQARMS